MIVNFGGKKFKRLARNIQYALHSAFGQIYIHGGDKKNKQIHLLEIVEKSLFRG